MAEVLVVRAGAWLEIIIFYGLLAVLVLTAIPYGAVQPWWANTIVCLILLLCSLRVAHGLLAGTWAISGVTMLVPLFGIFLFAIVQTLPLDLVPLPLGTTGSRWTTISTDPHETKRFAFLFLAVVLAGEALLRYSTTKRRLSVLVHVVAGIGVACAVFGMLRQLLEDGKADFLLPGLRGAIGYAQFINHNHFAFLMEMTLGLLLGLVLGKNAQRKRILFYVAMALLVWAALVFTKSRGGIISMLGLLLFGTVLLTTTSSWRVLRNRVKPSRRRLFAKGLTVVMCGLLAGSLVLVTAVSVAWVGGDPVVTRLETIPGELSEGDESKLRRVDIWRATWLLIKDHPISGVGFGGYWTAIPQYAKASGRQSLQQAHNDYLEVLASGGLIGTSLAVWFLVAFVGKARRVLRSADPFRRNLCMGALTGLFGAAIHSLFDFGLHIPINALVFCTLIVIATVGYSERNGCRRGSSTNLS